MKLVMTYSRFIIPGVTLLLAALALGVEIPEAHRTLTPPGDLPFLGGAGNLNGSTNVEDTRLFRCGVRFEKEEVTACRGKP